MRGRIVASELASVAVVAGFVVLALDWSLLSSVVFSCERDVVVLGRCRLLDSSSMAGSGSL